MAVSRNAGDGVRGRTHAEGSGSVYVHLRLVPGVPTVVPTGPEPLCDAALQQVHVESHGARRAVHEVPELEAMRPGQLALRAEHAGGVTVEHAVALNIHGQVKPLHFQSNGIQGRPGQVSAVLVPAGHCELDGAVAARLGQCVVASSLEVVELAIVVRV
ncbi:hypothetical protein ANANG_G00126970 [Anguilla anguilla]|uniref:Uncharacterized protein n=1 Tax=Anguilla anguilla TaxID=7936 RepID=A0A9D3MHU4_ANGAN|nr:hypothetical protein ANANG_G00126970 [Anguilla anguilla]